MKLAVWLVVESLAGCFPEPLLPPVEADKVMVSPSWGANENKEKLFP